jgi:hypothetical protein
VSQPSKSGGGDPYKRGARGQFAKGNRGGPGNPLCGQLFHLRKVGLNRIKKRRGVQRALDKLLAAIDEGGELHPMQYRAIREILDRAGISAASMLDERKVDVEEQLLDKLTELEQ